MRHISSLDFIIEDNSLSLVIGRSEAIRMGIPAEEYDAAVACVENANVHVKSMNDSTILTDVIVLQYDQNTPGFGYDSVTKCYGDMQNMGLDVTCTSSADGANAGHYLYVNGNTHSYSFYFNSDSPRFVEAANVGRNVSFRYFVNPRQGTAFIVVYKLLY